MTSFSRKEPPSHQKTANRKEPPSRQKTANRKEPPSRNRPAAVESQKYAASTVFPPVVCGCLLFGLSLGIRMNYGILLNAYADHAGLPYDRISLAVAVGELVYGLTQPLFGMVAIRRSNGFVLKIGLLLLAAGFIASASVRSVPLLIVTLGILLSAGTGAVCFGIVTGAVSPFIPQQKAAAVSGIINASSGIGSSLMSPLMEGLMSAFGLTKAMLLLSLPALALLPAVCRIGAAGGDRAGRDRAGGDCVNRDCTGGDCVNRDCTGGDRNESSDPRDEKERGFSFLQTFREAIRFRTYRYLMIGFATCGFHMSLIQNHFFSQIISYGIDKKPAALAYTVFGVGTMAGALLCGLLCSKLPLKNVLGTLYLSRVVIIAVFFFLLPKNITTVVIFAAALGLCGDATVTPTSELVSRRFGTANMAFLFGVVFVCHQSGAFFSAWLAGTLFDMTESYLPVWLFDLGFCALAAFVSYRIKTSENPSHIHPEV